jgi:hypothetical protein
MSPSVDVDHSTFTMTFETLGYLYRVAAHRCAVFRSGGATKGSIEISNLK